MTFLWRIEETFPEQRCHYVASAHSVLRFLRGREGKMAADKVPTDAEFSLKSRLGATETSTDVASN